jgi:hypothetical protein
MMIPKDSSGHAKPFPRLDKQRGMAWTQSGETVSLPRVATIRPGVRRRTSNPPIISRPNRDSLIL